MDPAQTLMEADQAVSDCDISEAIILLVNYYQWRLKGGFEPTGLASIRGKSRGDEIADIIAAALATQAADKRIGAAPEMAEALRLAVADLQLISDENGGSHGRTIDACLAALTKAGL